MSASVAACRRRSCASGLGARRVCHVIDAAVGAVALPAVLFGSTQLLPLWTTRTELGT
jgi:hypothetical protein